MKWTPDQHRAIESRAGTVLVSAAAGSGKTSVLVERVTQRLADPTEPCPADALLVVTFTNAAAASMRGKISESIANKLAKNPGDRHLARQQLLLPLAKICTIDSFCNSLVRENFFSLSLSPDFRILEGGEGQILRRETASQVADELYAEGADGFFGLLSLVPKGRRGEGGIEDVILSLYDVSQAYPFPEDMLDGLLEEFRSAGERGEGSYGKTIRRYITEAALFCAEASEKILEITKGDDALSSAYSPAVSDDVRRFTVLARAAESGSREELSAAVERANEFPSLGSSRKAADLQARDAAAELRTNVVKKIAARLLAYFDISPEEHARDMAALAPRAEKLVEMTRLFSERFAAAKRERNVIDFSDAEHLAMRLLVEKKPDGAVVKTPLAHEIASRYREILIDEYQDVNELQDMLFSALSREESNLFFVGDVKQSIYGFRQAMPEIFLKRRASMPAYEPGVYPGSIVLDRNFRSRSGVTDAVNFVFSRLMTERTGGVEYRGGEELVPAADYPDSATPCAELHILTDGGGEDDAAAQAKYIAELIKKNIAEGLKVVRDGEERPASFGDFTVLLRSARGTAARYTEVLTRNGVPAYASLDDGFTVAAEIRFMLALLRVVDNPCRDIPLLAVLLSPVFGFSPDKIARLKLRDRRASIYRCVKDAADGGDARCAGFMGALARMRRLAATVGTGELIRRLYDETGFLAIAGAMTDAGRRRANLRLLEDYANRYEAQGYIGLPGFIRFMDKIERSDSDLAPASELSSAADVVRVMSIHKSKGLEFPVCIIAGCEKKFNSEDSKKNIVVSRRTGIGMKLADEEKNCIFDTQCRRAALIDMSEENIAEELRVLYVAMTRAKERLIMLASDDSLPRTLRRLRAGVSADETAPFAVGDADSYEKWLLCALMTHPDAHELRALAGISGGSVTAKADFNIKIEIGSVKTDAAREEDTPEGDEDTSLYEALIDERLSYKYPYAALAGVAAKLSASELGGGGEADFELRAPSFVSGTGLSPAERGVAMHKFMQFCDYAAAREDVTAQREELKAKGFLTEREADSLGLSKLDEFFSSDIARRIFSADEVFRERRIAMAVPAAELYAGAPEDVAGETVLVQGIADCAFVEDGGIVVVDYKTDRADADELKSRYRAQLEFYGRALGETLGLPVRELLLYSFYLGGCVALD